MPQSSHCPFNPTSIPYTSSPPPHQNNNKTNKHLSVPYPFQTSSIPTQSFQWKPLLHPHTLQTPHHPSANTYTPFTAQPLHSVSSTIHNSIKAFSEVAEVLPLLTVAGGLPLCAVSRPSCCPRYPPWRWPLLSPHPAARQIMMAIRQNNGGGIINVDTLITFTHIMHHSGFTSSYFHPSPCRTKTKTFHHDPLFIHPALPHKSTEPGIPTAGKKKKKNANQLNNIFIMELG